MLSTIIFLPIVASILLLFFNNKSAKFYQYYGLVFSVLNLAINCLICTKFNFQDGSFQLIEQLQIFRKFDIKYFVGVDGISLSLITLTSALIPLCFLISFSSIKDRVKEFTICFLLIEGLTIGSFASLDLVFFYFFFEAILLPMFLVIGIWGSQNRIYAAYKFFLFTLFGSLFFLIAIVFLVVNNQTADITILTSKLPQFFAEYQQILIDKNLIFLGNNLENLIWLGFFMSFAIKVPMFPFHNWLPDAHVQAPTTGSVILAGVLIKLGAFGFIRFSLPMLPNASIYFSTTVLVLSAIAIIYASLIALAQHDIKKTIAYSSIAHMGFVTGGIFSLNQQGIDGAIMQMISHGIVSAALFSCVGIIYERLHTKQIKEMGGIAKTMPNFAILAMIFTMASVGLPGTSGFVGEFLSIVAIFQNSPMIATISALGVVLGASYMLLLYKNIWFGEIKNPVISKFNDLSTSEAFVLTIMATATIVLGVYPKLLMQVFSLNTSNIANIFTNILTKH